VPDVTTTTAYLGLVLDCHVAVGKCARDVEQQATRDDDAAFALDRALELGA